MIPAIIPIGAVVPNPQTIQYSRTAYNAGYVSSGSMTINIESQMPYVRTGDLMRIDGLYWQGAWCSLWQPRVAFYFKYGTSYNSGIISGGSSKNHVIYFQYNGGTSATIGHYYTGADTDFPRAEVSIDRLYWFDTTSGSFNYFIKSLPT